jgi:alkanesulfonate monooxygenase SsuD/methylene tetrahydromethanopterin reductase-like flavin-dependent oxidoreductase (luciferase family)
VTDVNDRKQIHLAAWSGPAADGLPEFETVVRLAETAERGLLDFLLVAEGSRLPDTCTVLAALTAVTERLGLVGTVDTTSNEPFEVARQFATLDHLSDGRAGWNPLASSDAGTADRYQRADEFLTVAQRFWDSWDADAVVADDVRGVYVEPDRIHAVEHRGAHFDVRGVATLPARAQGHPVLVHADDSPDGRNFGAMHADVLIIPHAELKSRAAAGRRDPHRLKVFSSIAVEQFVGTPEHVAAEIDLHVQSGACDGFVLVPNSSGGLDEFVDHVVPVLQQRGTFRTEYPGFTLREQLGL